MEAAILEIPRHHALDLEPLSALSAVRLASPWRRVLVAGVGDPFRGDEGFGSEVARRLDRRPLPPGVEVLDFTARGLDVVFALQQGYQAALLIDTARRGEKPGTLTVIEPDADSGDDVPLDPAALDPVGLVRFARLFGRVPAQVLVVVCEPHTVPPVPRDPRTLPRLTPPVAEAADHAVPLVESLIADLLAAGPKAPTRLAWQAAG